MKKLLFIIAVSIAGLGYAQAPQITDAQLENSRVIKEKTEKFDIIVDQKVDKMMSVANLDNSLRSTLKELVHNKEYETATIKRESISDIMKQSKINDVSDLFEKQLKSLLGEEKYNMVKNTLSPK